MVNKSFDIGDLVYFDKYKNDIGIVVSNGYSDPVSTYSVFWFNTLKYSIHSSFYIHKVKHQR